MIDWLRRNPRLPSLIDLGGAQLPVVVRRHARAKAMTLRLSPDGREVRVTIPRWGRDSDAIAFAQARRDWLAGQLAGLPVFDPLGHGSKIGFRGEVLSIRHDPAAPRRVSLGPGEIVLGGPQTSLQGRLRRWLEAEARALMSQELGEYCQLAGKPAPRLALSSAKRRWGSCAPDGSIRLNWRLIMAPDAVRRSVVAHEVTHLVHFDHSPRFHALLAQLFEGDVAEANAWLKRHGRTLYLPFG
jgi:predicted metal-dependent hydrolase